MISVCICTHNRSQSLRRTLDSLVEQEHLDEGEVEVLIVDNNCVDDTSQVVEAFQKALPIRLVTENQQGLACARNRAVKEFGATFFCSLTTISVSTLDGSLPIGMHSDAFRTPITLVDAFFRTGAMRSLGG